MSKEIETEPIELGELPADDFFNRLKTETVRDKDPKEAPPAPGSTQSKKKTTTSDDDPDDDDDDSDLDDLSNPGLVADILIDTLDMFHNAGMQIISGEPDPALWNVPATGKKRIKKAATKLIERFNFNMHPGVALAILVLSVYGPTTLKAASMRKRKNREKEAAENGTPVSEVKPPVEIKKSPGRPPGAKNK